MLYLYYGKQIFNVEVNCSNKNLTLLYTKVKEANDLDQVRSEIDTLYACMNKKLWGKCLNKFRSNIPPLSEEDIEDEYSQGWMNFLIKRDKFNPEKVNNIYSYLLTIMINLVKNRLIRKNNHEVEFTAIGLNADDDENEDKQVKFEIMLQNTDQGNLPAVIDEASYQIKKRAIDDALETLEGRQIQIYRMRVEQEIGFKEIAMELDMQTPNVHRTFNSVIKRIDHYFQSKFNITLEDYLRDCDV
ncbi:MAG: sigma-70 family RNA polymerase sigma factor [Ignavibacteriae bacterium]|nr:sigma-70 family RNA polymerase sigma factor [Ignavibacteriota bacterium]